jgi:hypothetical protein
MLRPIRILRRRLSPSDSSQSDERGFILVWFALLIFVMIGVTAFAVDLGHAYLVGQQEQNAADAAALSAAPYLPDNCPNANEHAQAIAALNGFTHGADDAQVVAVNGSPGGTGCNADPTLKTNEIRVSVKKKVDTWFARAIGIDTLTISRTSTAEYDPPVALGSPTNYFGNIVGCNTCAQPDIWASIAGQAQRKSDGNAIYAGWCVGTNGDSSDNCPGSALNNSDRDTAGMLLQIKNPQLESLNLELFDPGYVDTGQRCGVANALPINPLCSGDNSPAWLGNPAALETTYTLYPLDNLSNPLGNPPVCSATYPGYTTSPPPVGATDITARSFHRWANFATDAGCPALTASSYVLQVQSGDDLGKPAQRGFNNFSVAACSGCPANQPTLDPNVSISAITKMALFANTDRANPNFYLARVPSWARDQVLTLSFFDVGDISNTSGNPLAGNLTVAAVDATHGSGGAPVGEFSGCSYSHPASRGTNSTDYISGQTTPWDPGALDTSWATNPNSLTSLGGGCTASVPVNPSRSLWNGKWVTWKVQIPSDYTCNDLDQTKCWLQIRYAYTNAQFHDETTWTASLSGNPVRLTR